VGIDEIVCSAMKERKKAGTKMIRCLLFGAAFKGSAIE